MIAHQDVRPQKQVNGLSVERRFHKELVDLPREAQKKIVRALQDLQRDPTYLSKPLQGSQGVWRRQVPPYRILFTLAPGWVHVYSVQHRQGVYQGAVAAPTALPAAAPPPFTALLDSPRCASNDTEETTAFPWEAVGNAIVERSEDDIMRLIDYGLPVAIFDRLAALLAEPRPPVGQIRRLKLIRHNVIDAFFDPVLRLSGESTPLELILVSPWITPWDARGSSLTSLIRFVKRNSVPLVVICRPPILPAHVSAVRQLSACPTAEVVALDNLHAKFYMADVPPVPRALLSSANSTAQSLVNFEVGVSIEGAGEAESLVRELQGLAVELRGLGTVIKRRTRKGV